MGSTKTKPALHEKLRDGAEAGGGLALRASVEFHHDWAGLGALQRPAHQHGNARPVPRRVVLQLGPDEEGEIDFRRARQLPLRGFEALPVHDVADDWRRPGVHRHRAELAIVGEAVGEHAVRLGQLGEGERLEAARVEPVQAAVALLVDGVEDARAGVVDEETRHVVLQLRRHRVQLPCAPPVEAPVLAQLGREDEHLAVGRPVGGVVLLFLPLADDGRQRLGGRIPLVNFRHRTAQLLDEQQPSIRTVVGHIPQAVLAKHLLLDAGAPSPSGRWHRSPA